MNIDVLERICDTLQIDIVDFFPQKITSKRKTNIQLDIDENDHLHIDIENRKLIIKKI